MPLYSTTESNRNGERWRGDFISKRIRSIVIAGNCVPCHRVQCMKNNTLKNKTGNRNAQTALAAIEAQITALKQQKATLAEPMKQRYAELRGELLTLEATVKELDPTWKPEPMKPKAEIRIAEVIAAKGHPMAADEITKELAGTFNSWKIKNTLKKRSTGPKAFFTLADGKYAVRAAA